MCDVAISGAGPAGAVLLRFPLACALLLAAAAGAAAQSVAPQIPDEQPAFLPVPAIEAGFRLLYEQKFPQARESFLSWEKQHPSEPFGHIALAASYLFEEFYLQGVLSGDFFLDDRKFLHGIAGKPDPARMLQFRLSRERAMALSRDKLRANPHDPEALYALTLAAGMQADALSILERKQFDSLRLIKDAEASAKLLLAERPTSADAWLALGAANYIIGSLSGATRFVLWFDGVHGDRKLGMEQLAKTASTGLYLRPFAKILLALAALREKQIPLARRLLLELTLEFPASPLFAAEFARVASIPLPAEIRR
jgi:hypothetical protein